MKFGPLFARKEKNTVKQKDVDQLLFDAGKGLLKLKSRYSVTLERELAIARANKERGVKNSANYSRIGIAYYSLNIVKTAQERLRDMTTDRELYNCMNEMSSVLGTINGVSGKIGRMDAKSLLSGINKMSGASSGAGKDMLKTLAALSGANIERTDSVPIDSLVSLDVIERLISGVDPDTCVNANEGVVTNTDEVMDVFSQILETEEVKPAETVSDELSMDDITELISKLK